MKYAQPIFLALAFFGVSCTRSSIQEQQTLVGRNTDAASRTTHEQAESLASQARQFQKNRDSSKAELLFKQALTLEDNPLIRIELASLLDKSDKKKEAFLELQALFGSNQWEGSFRTDPVVLALYASLQERMGSADRADEIRDRILVNYRPSKETGFPPLETNIKDPSLKKATVKLIEAIRLQSYGEDAESLERCKEATVIKPNFAMAHLMLGYRYQLAGAREDAIREYKIAENTGNLEIRNAAKDSLGLVTNKESRPMR